MRNFWSYTQITDPKTQADLATFMNAFAGGVAPCHAFAWQGATPHDGSNSLQTWHCDDLATLYTQECRVHNAARPTWQSEEGKYHLGVSKSCQQTSMRMALRQDLCVFGPSCCCSTVATAAWRHCIRVKASTVVSHCIVHAHLLVTLCACTRKGGQVPVGDWLVVEMSE